MIESFFSSDQLFVLELVNKIARSNSETAYLVGGAVRDLCLVMQSINSGHTECTSIADSINSCKGADLDFVVSGDQEQLAKDLASELAGELKLFSDFLTAKVVNFSKYASVVEIDLATFRQESYERPGALPKVMQASSIEADLKRRDCSFNAMAVKLDDLLAWRSNRDRAIEDFFTAIIDPFKGLIDLEKKRLCVLHASSFIDDPTRIFRLLRYAARIQGALSPETEKLLGEALDMQVFLSISSTRILNEIQKITNENCSAKIFKSLADYGVLNNLYFYDAVSSREFFLLLEGLDRLEKFVDLKEIKFNLTLLIILKFLNEHEQFNFLNFYGYGKKRSKILLKKLKKIEEEVDMGSMDSEELLLSSVFSMQKDLSYDRTTCPYLKEYSLRA